MAQREHGKEFSYEIKAHLGVIKRMPSGWTKEVNVISWNGGPAKLDIREWSGDHQHMSKGMTLYRNEAELLVRLVACYLREATEAEGPLLGESQPVPVDEPAGQTEPPIQPLDLPPAGGTEEAEQDPLLMQAAEGL